MLTPEDLRNPKRASGFDHVNHGKGRGRQTGNPYAQIGGSKADPRLWRGPRRKTTREAAQDYCDYVNGVEIADARAALDTPGFVYCISDGTAVKVGFSIDPKRRIASLQTGNPRRLILLAQIPGTLRTESVLHDRYAAYNLLLEWFAPTPPLLREFGLTSPLYRKD